MEDFRSYFSISGGSARFLVCWKLLGHDRRSMTNLRRHHYLHQRLLKQLRSDPRRRLYLRSVAALWSYRALRLRRQGIKSGVTILSECWNQFERANCSSSIEQTPESCLAKLNRKNVPGAVKTSLRSALHAGKTSPIATKKAKLRVTGERDSTLSNAKTEQESQFAKDATEPLIIAQSATRMPEPMTMMTTMINKSSDESDEALVEAYNNQLHEVNYRSKNACGSLK